MSTLGYMIFVLWTIFIIYFSYELWINPSEYLRKRKNRRLLIGKSKLGLLFRYSNYSKMMDENPKKELRESKVVFIILYIFIVVGFYLLITGQLVSS
jgi:hypothetical protein